MKLLRYLKIDGGTLTEMTLLPPSTLREFEKGGSNILPNRIFMETCESYNPGDLVEFSLEIPDRGQYRGSGLVEWINDGSVADKPAGIALHLFRLTAPAFSPSPGSTDPEGSPPPPPPEKEIDYTKSHLPESGALRDLLEKLLDMKVTVNQGKPVAISPETPLAIATYKKDNGSIKVVWLCDLKFVIYSGAALSVIPPETAESSLSSGEIPDNIRDNFQEVLNVSTELLNKPDRSRISLGDTVIVPAEIPAEIADIVSNPRMRLDFSVKIPGYGEGRVSLLEK
ncbi:MAG: hypothetical protein JXB45_12985 [Candidatus Krumholzibacteriota bacterium]|nr:hypothetical protein [Candidatus Krumholzibacteriota bacterium]